MENVFRDYGRFENESNNQIICFNVTRTYLGGKRPSLYECVRKYWRLNGERAKKAEYVFAICSGYIEGVEISDSPYLHMDISQLVGKRQNPVSYINM